MVHILTIQLILTFFAPLIEVGKRSLFLGDLWIFLWAPYALFRFRGYRGYRTLLLAFICISIGYLHGYFRPELLDPLKRAGLGSRDSDDFQLFRELVVAFRFFSWVVAGVAVKFWWSEMAATERPGVLRQIRGTLMACVSVSGLLIILSRFSEPLHLWLTSVYGYTDELKSETHRLHANFVSPNEAGISLVLSCFVVWLMAKRKGALDWAFFGLAAISALLTEAVTPILAAVIGIAFIGFGRISRIQRLALTAAVLALSLVSYFASEFVQIAVSSKLGHFRGRIDPWIVYWNVGTSRPDHFLLGTGFSSFYVDNFFIFLFSRMGLLGLVAVLIWIIKAISKYWATWNLSQRSLVASSLVASLTLDSFILRPFAAIWICAVVVVLNL